MTTFDTPEGKHAFIDDRLKRSLDTVIIPQLKKKDKDAVFCVDGKERIGKSKFADIFGGYVAMQLGTKYDITNICMTPEEFKKKVQECPKNSVVIYDEAHRGMGSRRALSEINHILVDLMMEMGQKNLFILIVLPTYFMLDKYPALYRTKGLFHIYERKNIRGFWVYFNEKQKLRLYNDGKKFFDYNCMHWPHFRGRFYEQYIVNEEEYRKKKALSFEDKPRETKGEKYLRQRNVGYYILSKEFNLSSRKISLLLKKYGQPQSKSVIVETLKQFNVQEEEEPDIEDINDTADTPLSTIDLELDEENNLSEGLPLEESEIMA